MSTAYRTRRILMTTDVIGGVFHYALELAAALADHGVVTALATMGPAMTHGQRSAARAVPGLELYESTYRLEWMPEPWTDVERAGTWLRELEAKIAPDVVHLNGYAHADLPFRAPTVVVAHSCVLSWWQAVRGSAAPANYDEYRRRVTRGLLAASQVVAPTHSMARALHAHYGQSFSCRVIANGRSPIGYRAANKEPYVLAMGRLWDDAKNIGALAEIAGSLPWPVRVAGCAALDKSHSAASESWTNIELLGQLDSRAARAALAGASIYALPARYEPFGLSVLEAALSSCALVLSDIPSLRELWDGCALFVAPDDHDALRRAILQLTETPKERASLAKVARDRALRYGRDSMGRAYLSNYEELLVDRTSLAELQVVQCA